MCLVDKKAFFAARHVHNAIMHVSLCGLPSLNSLGPSHRWSARCHHFQLNLSSIWDLCKHKPVLFMNEKALHFSNYSHFWMFSVIVQQHYCQSNIYDKVLSAWHVNEKVVVSFGGGGVIFSLWSGSSFASELCWLVPATALEWAECSQRMLKAAGGWRWEYMNGISDQSQHFSLVPHCAVNVKSNNLQSAVCLQLVRMFIRQPAVMFQNKWNFIRLFFLLHLQVCWCASI